DMTTEEYFGDTEYLDGAYYHFPYIKRNADDDISPGIVMEAGGGGNAGSYYDPEISYATAYELTAATGITHMEGDFWVSAPNSIAKNSQNSDFVERYQAILNYGIGYTDGMEDNVKPLDPDFISVTSRKVNRPWGQDWHPWTWHLNWNASPEWVLAKKGYIFNGISEDGIFDMIKEPQKVVSYSPDRPMKYHFDGMMEKSSQGLIENMIIPAISLRQIVTNDYALKDIGEVYPEFSAKHEKTKLSGILNDSEKTIVNTDTEVYTMENEGFTPVLSVGKTPVVVEKNNGKGKIYMVLFDPNAQENYELTAAVYNELLGKQGVKAHWETLEATGEAIGDDKLRDNDPLVGKGIMESEASVRLYQNDDLTVVGVQNPYARYHKKNEKRSTKLASPYEIKGNTKVKARLTPNVEYDWVALPSGKRGSVKADAEGFAEFGFSDTSHEIFYAMPKSAESSIKLSRILGRKLVLTDAISVDGNAQLADVCPPVTQLDVIGEKTATGSYKNGASVTLTATDSSRGSGMKRLEYSLNDGNFMSIRNRSALNKNEVSTSVKLNKNGVNTIKYRATDNRGNVEPLGTIEVVVD
ncbi:MAG: hypothetical protein RR957_01325, partial [Oscillospiraceae bacterium]